MPKGTCAWAGQAHDGFMWTAVGALREKSRARAGRETERGGGKAHADGRRRAKLLRGGKVAPGAGGDVKAERDRAVAPSSGWSLAFRATTRRAAAGEASPASTSAAARVGSAREMGLSAALDVPPAERCSG